MGKENAAESREPAALNWKDDESLGSDLLALAARAVGSKAGGAKGERDE